MWGELVGASWHKYGASWSGRVGFGANRLALEISIYVARPTRMREAPVKRMLI